MQYIFVFLRCWSVCAVTLRTRLFLFRVELGDFVRHVMGERWSRSPCDGWMMFFQQFRFVSGSSRFRGDVGGCLLVIIIWQEVCLKSVCIPSLHDIEDGRKVSTSTREILLDYGKTWVQIRYPF